MEKNYGIESVADYYKLVGTEKVSIIDFSVTYVDYTDHIHFYYGPYAVVLKETVCGD